MTPLVIRTCESCGQSFELTPRRARRVGRGRYCTPSCASRERMRARHQSQPHHGEHNPNWKGGISRDNVRYTRRFKAKFPLKAAAQRTVYDALRTGEMTRPDACSACGVLCKPHGHHDDYTKPLAVRWLCRPCHTAHHVAVRAAQRKAA
jgi:hypothetical protein